MAPLWILEARVAAARAAARRQVARLRSLAAEGDSAYTGYGRVPLNTPIAEEVEMADVTSPLLGARVMAQAGTPLATEASLIPVIGHIIGAGLLIASLTPRSLKRKMSDVTQKAMDSSTMPGSQVIPEIKELFRWIWHKISGKPDSTETDDTSNDIHSQNFGATEPRAHCFPGFPNHFTVAAGTPLVTS